MQIGSSKRRGKFPTTLIVGLDVVSPCPSTSNGTTSTFIFVTHRKDMQPREHTETHGQSQSHSAPKTRGKNQPSAQVRVDNIKLTLHKYHSPTNAQPMLLGKPCPIAMAYCAYYLSTPTQSAVPAGNPLALQGILYCAMLRKVLPHQPRMLRKLLLLRERHQREPRKPPNSLS